MPDEIMAISMRALQNNGAPEQQAEIVAGATLAAELRGVSSHGLQMLPVYIERLHGGGLRADAYPKITQVSEGMYFVDGQGGFGQVAAQAATDIILEQLCQNHMAMVSVFNTNHCGMLAYYTRQIARHYAVGFMAANTNPNVPAFGGAEKVLGTNPFSVAIPLREDCILIDMATTAISKGKIYEYEKQGQILPPDCALNKQGEPTCNPEEAIDGLLLPFAGHKGYAISLAVELLAGLISGAGYSKHTYSLHAAPNKQQNLGAFMQGIPLAPLMGHGLYEQKMEDFSAMLKESKKASGSDAIYFPGEIEQGVEKVKMAEGIDVRDDLLFEIQKL